MEDQVVVNFGFWKWEIGKFSSNRSNFNPSIFKLFPNTKVNLALNKFPNLSFSKLTTTQDHIGLFFATGYAD
jgi:hypothetical protein